MRKPFVLVSGEKESGKDTFADMLSLELAELMNNATPIPVAVSIPRSSSTSAMVPAGAAIGGRLKIGRFAFADPIKRALGEILGIPDALLWGNSETKETHVSYSKTIRHWAQWLGTEAFRDHVHPAIWVHKALRAVTGIFPDRFVSKDDAGWIISDCRFGNEYSMARDILERNGGLPVWAGPLSHEAAAKITSGETAFSATQSVPQGLYQTFLYRVWRRTRPTARTDTHRSENVTAELDQFDPVIVDNSGTLEALRAIAKIEAAKIFEKISS